MSAVSPKGSFYYFFPGGKNQLGVEVLNYAYERMEQGIQALIFPVSDNAEDVFVKMAHHIADMLENHKGVCDVAGHYIHRHRSFRYQRRNGSGRETGVSALDSVILR